MRQQRRVLSRADAAVVFSERDRGLVAPATSQRTEVVTIPVGWEVPTVSLDPVGTDPPTLRVRRQFPASAECGRGHTAPLSESFPEFGRRGLT